MKTDSTSADYWVQKMGCVVLAPPGSCGRRSQEAAHVNREIAFWEVADFVVLREAWKEMGFK